MKRRFINPVAITIDNYKKCRPSDVIYSAIDDLDAIRKKGFQIHMTRFFWVNGEACVCCLAGAAVSGFTNKITQDYVKESSAHLRIGKELFEKIFDDRGNEMFEFARLFDCIRTGKEKRGHIVHYINKIWETNLEVSVLNNWQSADIGTDDEQLLDDQQINALKESLKSICQILQKAGY